MPIKGFKIQNFRGFKNIDFTFPENRQTVVFIGDNGVGKSSLLDAIALNLSHFVDRLMWKNEYDFENILTFEDINVETAENCLVEIEWCVNLKENKNMSLKWNTYFNRTFSSPHYKHKELKAFLLELGQKPLSTEPLALPALIHYRPERMVFIQENEKKETTKYSFVQLKTYENAFSRQLQSFQSFIDWFKTEEDIENELKIKERNFDIKSPNLEAIRNALQTFLNQLPDTHFENLRYERQTQSANPATKSGLYIDKNGVPLLLNQLSSGEKMLLLMVADIARRMAMARPNGKPLEIINAVILIDEIDLHLHPRWQRQVIPALEKTFPTAQFIVTTHSEQVLSNIPNDAVFEITEMGLVRVENTFGKDNDWISRAVMRDESRPTWVLAELEGIFEAIRSNHLEDAKIKKEILAEKIGADDTELIKAEMMINRKLKQLI